MARWACAPRVLKMMEWELYECRESVRAVFVWGVGLGTGLLASLCVLVVVVVCLSLLPCATPVLASLDLGFPDPKGKKG